MEAFFPFDESLSFLNNCTSKVGIQCEKQGCAEKQGKKQGGKPGKQRLGWHYFCDFWTD